MSPFVVLCIHLLYILAFRATDDAMSACFTLAPECAQINNFMLHGNARLSAISAKVNRNVAVTSDIMSAYISCDRRGRRGGGVWIGAMM